MFTRGSQIRTPVVLLYYSCDEVLCFVITNTNVLYSAAHMIEFINKGWWILHNKVKTSLRSSLAKYFSNENDRNVEREGELR